MGTAYTLQAGFRNLISKAGTQVKITYFNQIFDDVYDEITDLAISGTVWTSGIVMPLSNRYGTTDSLLLEQGKLSNADKKIYVAGSLLMTGSDLQVKIQIGSPNGESYSMMPDGAIVHEVEGQMIYKKMYLRRLTGSLYGE